MKTTEKLGRATYSPEDNKLRFYPDSRLSTADYTRARGAGFKWAPKQELFVAPMWTPEREDLLLEWCGEIEDEDKSLVGRAEERAERFEDYSDSRRIESDQAHAAVESICEHIPLGQPILVGHHSERRARKDAERIENEMRKAVKLWETSKYWQERARGAIRHAKYKELPDVRARRIKGIEADKRKVERTKTGHEAGLRFWRGEMKTKAGNPFEISEANLDRIVQALGGIIGNTVGVYLPKKEGDTHDTPSAYSCLSNSYPSLYVPRTVAEVQQHALKVFERGIERCNRWLAHYDNRLSYERAMLAEEGGIVADRFALGVGGQVLRRGKWHIVTKLNGGTNGRPQSVSVVGHWAGTIPVEEIEDYKAPAAGDFEKTKAATSTPPLCNYPGEGFATMTQSEWDNAPKDYKTIGRRSWISATDTICRHRVRVCLGVYAKLPPPTGEELSKNYCSANRTHRYWRVFITDAKRKDPPAVNGGVKPELPERAVEPPRIYQQTETNEQSKEFERLREMAKAGVQVVSAPQLFPTPKEIARKMVDRAGIIAGRRVLEPSAGTGNLIEAAAKSTGFDCFRLVAVEINQSLIATLETMRNHWLYANGDNFKIVRGDFLECNGDLGKFDIVLMNPPFENGSDIKHIKHAMTFLKPGGRLVAICANGPRQQAELQPLADTWEELPVDTFKEEGTSVRTVLITINK